MKQMITMKYILKTYAYRFLLLLALVNFSGLVQFLTPCPLGHSTSLQELTLGQMVRLSTLIFKGEVLSKETFKDAQGSFWTHYVIRCDESWKGKLKPQELFELTLRGGVIGKGSNKEGQVIHGQVDVSVGQEGVLFLEYTNSGRWVFTGMNQGWYELIEKAGDVIALRPNMGSHLHKPIPKQFFTGVEQNLNTMPLKSLKQRVLRGAKRIPSFGQPIQPVKVYPLSAKGDQ